MLKGQVFENQIFNNGMFALFENMFLNGESGINAEYGEKMNVTYNGSSITVHSGACIIFGRIVQEDTFTTVDAGTTAVYGRLVIEVDLSKSNTNTEFNQAYYKIVTSTNEYPSLIQENLIQNTTGKYQFSLARFKITSNGISDFVDERKYIDFDSIYAKISRHIQAISDEKIFMPIGSGCDFFGTELPNENYMWADGSEVSRDDYAELFAVIGTAFGEGDGITTFNLPDKRERVSVMYKNGSTNGTSGATIGTLGAKGGEFKHTLNKSELPNISLGIKYQTFPITSNNDSNNTYNTDNRTINFNTKDKNSTSQLSTEALGSGISHNNMQPYLVCNYIVRVK